MYYIRPQLGVHLGVVYGGRISIVVFSADKSKTVCPHFLIVSISVCELGGPHRQSTTTSVFAGAIQLVAGGLLLALPLAMLSVGRALLMQH